MNYKEIVYLLTKLYQLRGNKDKIPAWRPYYLIKIGISSYTFYKLTPILEREGIIKNDKSIDWDKLEQVINRLEKSIKPKEEELDMDKDFDYDPYYEQFVNYELKKKDGNK